MFNITIKTTAPPINNIGELNILLNISRPSLPSSEALSIPLLATSPALLTALSTEFNGFCKMSQVHQEKIIHLSSYLYIYILDKNNVFEISTLVLIYNTLIRVSS